MFMAGTNVTPPPPAPKKRRGFLRFILWLFAILIVLLVVGYFVATSSAFVKSVILPRVGKSMNADITAGDVSISPFKEVILKNLKVQTTGSEPLLTAGEVRARYGLMDIIRGKIKIDEIVVASPTVTLIENPDKTTNLDPITKSQTGKEKKPEGPSKPSKPVELDLKKLELSDATVRKIKLY